MHIMYLSEVHCLTEHLLLLRQAPSAASDWPLGQARASAPQRASPFSTALLSPFGADQALPPAPQSAAPGLSMPTRGSGPGALAGSAAADGREAPAGGASAAVPVPGGAAAQVLCAWIFC